MEDIEALTIGFEKYGKPSVEEARKLFVECAQEMIERVRANEEAQQYLHEKPFSHRSVRLSISFVGKDHHYQEGEHVSFILSARDKICYKQAIFKNGEHTTYKTILREPYEEALAIVQGAK